MTNKYFHGVNISKCNFFSDGICSIHEECSRVKDCHYKNWQRAEKQLEGVKGLLTTASKLNIALLDELSKQDKETK
jgi:hypothetical protein